jgi:hypothetical protein
LRLHKKVKIRSSLSQSNKHTGFFSIHSKQAEVLEEWERAAVAGRLMSFWLGTNMKNVLMEKFVEIVSRGIMLLYTKQTVFAKKP